jgi:hypothetical protein
MLIVRRIMLIVRRITSVGRRFFNAARWQVRGIPQFLPFGQNDLSSRKIPIENGLRAMSSRFLPIVTSHLDTLTFK